MDKKKIFSEFALSDTTIKKIEKYIEILSEYNQHTNLVGKSTLKNPWSSHILDSLQILNCFENKKKSILDMGTGAGIPGNILSISGCENVTLVDSNGKKTKFLEIIKKKLDLKTNIVLERLENINNIKFDIITCRALANLNQLISYSQKFVKKNTVLIFLKGKTVNDEILDAQKKWKFNITIHQSMSDLRGRLLVIKNIKQI